MSLRGLSFVVPYRGEERISFVNKMTLVPGSADLLQVAPPETKGPPTLWGAHGEQGSVRMPAIRSATSAVRDFEWLFVLAALLGERDDATTDAKPAEQAYLVARHRSRLAFSWYLAAGKPSSRSS
jgi:hypothetical protein